MSEAERLFAERGIENVSLKDITEAADTNIAAVNYHFGSKQKLIEALVDRGAGEYARRRARFLEHLEGADELALRPVVEALIAPTAEMVSAAPDGRHYVRFVARLAAHPDYLPLVNRAYDLHTNRYIEILRRVTPELSEPVRMLRFVAAKELVNQFVGEASDRLPAWLTAHAIVGFDEMSHALTDMLVGLFLAPETTRELDKELDDGS